MSKRNTEKNVIVKVSQYMCGNTKGFTYLLNGQKGSSLAKSWTDLKRKLDAYEPRWAKSTHICPCCGGVAFEEDFDGVFGFRRVKTNMSVYVQSHCRNCRKEIAKEKEMKKAA